MDLERDEENLIQKVNEVGKHWANYLHVINGNATDENWSDFVHLYIHHPDKLQNLSHCVLASSQTRNRCEDLKQCVWKEGFLFDTCLPKKEYMDEIPTLTRGRIFKKWGNRHDENLPKREFAYRWKL